MSIPAELQGLLDKYSLLSLNDDRTKVICMGTGHEMPLKADTVQSYVDGKKFKKVKEYKELVAELGKHKEFIVPSNKPQCAKLYFCKLTLRHLNRDAAHVKKHVNGKRFQRALKRWEECKKKGIEYSYPGKRPKKHQAAEDEETEAHGGTEADKSWMKDFYPAEDEEDSNEASDEFQDLSEDDGDFKDLSEEETEAPKAMKSKTHKEKTEPEAPKATKSKVHKEKTESEAPKATKSKPKKKKQNGQENGTSQSQGSSVEKSAKKRKAPQNEGPIKKKSKKKIAK